MAHDFAEIAPEMVDAVLLNSVVQYFPSIAYLLSVLEGAVKAVAPGGFIFIGDVRSLPMLKALHTSVLLYQAPADTPAADLRQQVQRNMNLEEELILDPDFFMALKQHFPQISHVQILLKRGRHHNELTRFRYNVVLYIGAVAAAPQPVWLNYQQEQLTLPAVRQMLAETQPQMLGLTSVPNARLLADIRAIELLERADAPATVGELRQALHGLDMIGVDPEDLWALTDQLPYTVSIGWPASGWPDSYDVLFSRQTEPATASPPIISFPAHQPARPRRWQQYANSPLLGKYARRLVPRLRSYLEARLPDYMVPAAFVTLERWPTTPNGKIDRQMLPVPERLRPELEDTYVLPRTPTETALASIWAEVLGLEHVGVQDDFFGLGGHSLLATRVVSRVRQSFQIELPLQILFEARTVAGLAKGIETIRRITHASQVAVAASDREEWAL
jgi:acyl carrier protein